MRITLQKEDVLLDPQFQFAPTSNRILEGIVRADYTWTATYLNYRRLKEPPPTKDDAMVYLRELRRQSSNYVDRYRGALIGLAVGDALGAANELKDPGTFEPITDIVGGGPFSLKPGIWTDDTSMTYALGQSLLNKQGHDPFDQMLKYLAWYKYGAFSPTGKCIDIGTVEQKSLIRFEITGKPLVGSTETSASGNGSLMRIAPIALYYCQNPRLAVEMAEASSRTTHQTPEAIDACRFFAALIIGAVQGVSKSKLLKNYEPGSGVFTKPLEPAIQALKEGAFIHKKADDIGSSGYVVTTLEAALWVFHQSHSFKEGALMCANMGGDTDTIGAVYGQLAGAFYGELQIPPEWIKKLFRFPIFYRQAEELLEASLKRAR